jgi:hypothetical protein
MKKLKTSFLAIALIAGVSGAFITKIAYAAKRSDAIYKWSSTSIAPDNPNQNNYDDTHVGAVAHFGCETGSQLCASGTKISGTGPSTDALNVTP